MKNYIFLFVLCYLCENSRGFGDLETLSKSLYELNAKLFQNSVRKDENTLYSPLGIADALSVLMLGARGETEKSLYDTLSASDTGIHHLSFKTLMEYYNKDKNGTKIVNWILVNSNNHLKEMFAKSADRVYKARVDIVNFLNDSKPAMQMVNNGVEKMTDGKINNIQKSPFDKRSVMVLINAISFKAKWKDPFVTENTHLMSFTNSDKSKVKVEMMYHELDQTKYVRNNDLHVKLIEPPYVNNYTMIVALSIHNQTIEELKLVEQNFQNYLDVIIFIRRYGCVIN
ncbi:serpin B11-like protein [Leptotrombidium deliense]|uniref:Serpin B11-like protein n=1 Tax=Leptotrombidium deliense TaxID=299467 RepID=A0A443SAS2_9ACAR|nr:serpin B11-like protein [Leptotrombidium deliense]